MKHALHFLASAIAFVVFLCSVLAIGREGESKSTKRGGTEPYERCIGE